MANEIDAGTLRGWLEEKRPVTVLDIRTDEDRAQWAIPGSVHLNAYDALRAGEAGPLADAPFPLDRPVVTVCNVGGVSKLAAAVLSERGFDARTLTGGMKAWSLAWNTAIVPLPGTSTRVIQVRRTGKGCLSYVIGSSGEAAVIDPALPPSIYCSLASQYGWRVRYVLETHVHADHLSRARQLAEQTGAALLIPDQRRVHFPFTPVVDGQEIAIGATKIAARRTPGHTDESTSYILKEGAVFTGDTLFTKGVGRPDLHSDAEGATQRAQTLFHSLARLLVLDPGALVLPAHTGEPIAFDGQAVCARLKDVAPALSEWIASEQTFVERITSRLPPTPPNFTRIVELNEAGTLPEGDPTDLEAGANRCAVS